MQMENSPLSVNATEYLQKWSIKEKLLLILLFIFGAILRFISLDWRPLHHDEAQYLEFGRRVWMDFHHGHYKYSPVMHGPLLFNLFAGIFYYFGDSVAAGRALNGVLNLFICACPYIFRRFFTKTQVIVASVLLLFSPSLIYWSRFVGHDTLMIFGAAVSFLALLARSYFAKAFLLFLGFNIQFSTKENFIVNIALILGYAIFELLLYFLRITPDAKGFLLARFEEGEALCRRFGKIFNGQQRFNIARFARHTTLPGAFFAALCFSLIFYSAFFCLNGFGPDAANRNFLMQMLVSSRDGMLLFFDKGLNYWWEHHNMERIKGPFLFQTYCLLVSDFLFCCLVLIALLKTLFALSIRQYSAAVGIFLVSFLATWYYKDNFDDSALLHAAKVKDNLDVFAVFFLALFAVFITYIYQIHSRKYGLLTYLFFASWFTYSFVGERVPWLAIYPMVAGVFFVSLLIGDLYDKYSGVFSFKTKVCSSCIIAILSYHFIALTNFREPGNFRDIISQVHTSERLQNIAHEIVRDLTSRRELGEIEKVYVEGDATWPLDFYFRSLNFPAKKSTYVFASNKGLPSGDYKYIFTDKADYREKKGYYSEEISLRGWWVPRYKDLSFMDWMTYIWLRQVPDDNPIGDHKVRFYMRQDS